MSEEKLIEIIEKYSSRHKQEKEKLPFHFNLLDAIGTDENGHTRILMQLLEYKMTDNKLAKEFTGLIKVFDKTVRNPKVEIGKDYIDGVISELNNYSIIIENKINDAIDQHKQIERYIDTQKKYTEADNIYVVYLTRDGNKKIEPSSLTDKAKKCLDWKSDKDPGRFIELNYKEHILPWLETEVLPYCKVKDDVFVSAVKQYIDHLNGMFGLRSIEKEMEKKMSKELENLLDISSKTLSEKHIKIKEIKSAMDKMKNTLENMENEIIEIGRDKFIEANKDILGNDFKSFGKGSWLQFYKPDWEKASIHYEWLPFTVEGDRLSFTIHIETQDKNLKDELTERLRKKLKDAGLMTKDGKDFSSIFFKSKQSPKHFSEMTPGEIKELILDTLKETEKITPLIDEVIKECL